MIRADNCIYFGEELASIYDYTRPFRLPNTNSPVLKEICHRLIDKNSQVGIIRVLDVGAGTGRITIPFANHYERYVADLPEKPILKIICVEKSPQMLMQLQQKVKDNKYEYVQIDAGTAQDIRDIVIPEELYDAVIAHWVFHVISDWRVAVYAIDSVLKPTAQIFLLSEQSELYSAIDGDYRDIGDEIVKNVWRSYHNERRRMTQELSVGAPIMPPRFRLGSMVIDDRVGQMFSALGWSICDEFSANGNDSWTSQMRLDDLINKVIRLRAFTNMRLLPQEVLARQKFEDMADKLLKELSPGDQKYTWNIVSTLSAQVLSRQEQDVVSDKYRELMLHVLRDTLGRRWKRRKEHAYNRNALWRRLFKNTWGRLNSDNEGIKQCGALGNEISEQVQGIYAKSPFIGTEDSARCFLHSCEKDIKYSCVISIWSNLMGFIESSDPICICFAGRESMPIVCENLAKLSNGAVVYPHINYIDISKEEEKLLLSVPIGSDKTQNKMALDECIRLRTGGLERLIKKAQQIGVLPYHNTDAQTAFLYGLSIVAKCDKFSRIYAFPFRADFQLEDDETMGMCLCSKGKISESALEFLWAMNDVLFNEYLEDALADVELHLHEETMQNLGPAFVDIKVREPASSDRWKDAAAPAILLIVSTKLELDTLIELAGVRDTLNQRRKKIGNSSVWRHELGFNDMPVWAVSTARAGSLTPGGSLSTVLNALASLPYKPYAVIMPGIAFGLQKRKQRLGDILVSDRICVYEMQKLSPRIKINRDLKPSATPDLIRLFQSCELNWSLDTLPEVRPVVDCGLMMSGEKLVNDPEFVAELLDREPEALGGEMEASGLYAGALELGVRWIMVKAICDWGMGKGDKFQKIAAQNSIDFVFHVLQELALTDAIRKEAPELLDRKFSTID